MTSRALATASSGMNFQQTSLEVQTQNIAAMDVPGFKEELMTGVTLDYTQENGVGTISSQAGTIVPAGVQKGQGVRPAGVVNKFIQGKPVNTGNPLHVMIQGQGYFQIELPTGDIAYTRDGVFTKNADGMIVNQQGYHVLPGLTIPSNATQVTINRVGEVFADIPGQLAPQSLGTIQLARFNNPDGLQKSENNLLLETAASGTPSTANPGDDGFGTLLQYHFESSNVDAVLAVTKLIMIQRAFEMNVKAEKAASEMMAELKGI